MFIIGFSANRCDCTGPTVLAIPYQLQLVLQIIYMESSTVGRSGDRNVGEITDHLSVSIPSGSRIQRRLPVGHQIKPQFHFFSASI